jgi:serine/threonine protein kinase
VLYAGKVFMKITLKKQLYVHNTVEEELLREVRSEHVIKFIDLLEDFNCYVIVLEYCQHGSIKQLIQRRQRLTEVEIKYYAI